MRIPSTSPLVIHRYSTNISRKVTGNPNAVLHHFPPEVFFLPPAYVVRREGNSFTLFVCPHRGGGGVRVPPPGGYPGQVPPPGGRGVPGSGTPRGSDTPRGVPGSGTPPGVPRSGTPPRGGHGYPGQVPPHPSPPGGVPG